jgi:ATP-dependent Lhr-like helicase
VFEPQILRARLPDYTPAWLDALGAAGELVWVGAGGLGLNDGWIVLAPADLAGSLLPDPLDTALSPLAERVRDALNSGGALFFRQIGERAGDPTDHDLLVALWELVWNGWATNDTLAPLRALVRRRPLRVGGRELPRRRPVSPARLGPPAGVGRWSLAPRREADATRRRYAWAEQLLRCHGVVTRGAVLADRIPGGFAGVYPVFQALEDRGRCRRGYFVEGLGGTQFALPGAVDRMRARLEPHRDTTAVVLAATDPANPYGAALPWPEAAGPDAVHRGGRKVGALVVLVDGRLAVHVERGGRTLVSCVDDESLLRRAAAALAAAAPAMLGRFELERVNGTAARDASAAHTALARALLDAGFRPTYRGLQPPA